MKSTQKLFALAPLLAALACSGGDDGTEAQKRGIGAACTQNSDCTEDGQTCLPFKGGYCGLTGCANDAACPAGSACVAHTDGKNYCFATCAEKTSCNVSRSADVEANCASNITLADPNSAAKKACVPPSGN